MLGSVGCAMILSLKTPINRSFLLHVVVISLTESNRSAT